MLNSMKDCLNIVYVVFAFCAALFLGALKAILVGPIAGLLLILGNVGVILVLFPAHVSWTVYALVKTERFDAAFKFVLLFALPPLFVLWLAISITGSVLTGVGYGFFAPWISTFEAFRHERDSNKFSHCILDGTWETIKGSCTVVQDFADLCYYSYPDYLKEFIKSSASEQTNTIRLVEVPAYLLVGLMGLIVEIPLYTIIALIKSPYMLFKGWYQLLHDLISREGPFLEIACVPVAGLVILLWPLLVIGSIILAIFSSFFIGLYGSVIAYQERSFQRGIAYVIAMVSEFDEYTNDWLYLREGSIFPKPQYRKKKVPRSGEFPVGSSNVAGGQFSFRSSDAPAMLVPSLAPSRSIREAIQEVKMVQIWENMMKGCAMRGKELLDAKVLTAGDLYEWSNAKTQETIIGIGLPSYSMLHSLLNSIKAGSVGLLLIDGTEVTQLNRPQDRLLDWFFQPVMVLKEQIKFIKLEEGELRFLEKITLFGSNTERVEAWENGSTVPQDSLRGAQIQAISRRVMGLTRNITKFPTYRRRYRNAVKAMITSLVEREGSSASRSTGSVASIENV